MKAPERSPPHQVAELLVVVLVGRADLVKVLAGPRLLRKGPDEDDLSRSDIEIRPINNKNCPFLFED